MEDLDKKCAILAELWVDYRDHEDFSDFVEYNDIGLPLAYILANDIAQATSNSTKFVEETWSLLLEELGLEDSASWDSIDEMLAEAGIVSEDDEDDDEGDDEGDDDDDDGDSASATVAAPQQKRMNIFGR